MKDTDNSMPLADAARSLVTDGSESAEMPSEYDVYVRVRPRGYGVHATFKLLHIKRESIMQPGYPELIKSSVVALEDMVDFSNLSYDEDGDVDEKDEDVDFD